MWTQGGVQTKVVGCDMMGGEDGWCEDGGWERQGKGGVKLVTKGNRQERWRETKGGVVRRCVCFQSVFWCGICVMDMLWYDN